MRIVRSTASVLLALSLLATQSAFAAPVAPAPLALPEALVAPARSAVPTDAAAGVIVKFKESQSAGLAIAEELSVGAVDSISGKHDAQAIVTMPTPPGQTAQSYAAQLAKRSDVEYAEPNHVVQPLFTLPTDPDFVDTTTFVAGGSTYPNGRHWWLDRISAASAWTQGFGATDELRATADQFKVAVIDTGVYTTHPDLAGKVIVGKDEFQSYTSGGGFVTDYDITPAAVAPNTDVEWASHGTACTGVIAAAVDGQGMVGDGYDAKVVGYKVAGIVNDNSTGVPAGSVVILDSQVNQAIRDAADAGCKVISMSLGGPVYDSAEQDAVNYAYAKGCIIVAAAGNDGNNSLSYPAADNHVVSVAALQLAGGVPTRASYSNYGPTVDIAAPGTLIWSLTQPGYNAGGTARAGYEWWTGTSLACPVVAGAAAFLWRAQPNLTNDEVVSYLENSAVDLGTPGRDDYYGYGMLGMSACYSRFITDYPTLAAPTISVPATSAASTVNATWGPVSGRNVTYQIAVDGVVKGTQATLSYSMTLPDGPHSLTVTPKSPYNWTEGGSVATANFIIDTLPPVVTSFSRNGAALSWTVSTGNAYTSQAYVDTATPVVVSSPTIVVPMLTSGAHTLHVNVTDVVGKSSGWVSWPFTYSVTPPGVSNLVVSDALSADVTWPAVPGASSYEYTIGGGSAKTTTTAGFTITGLTPSVVDISVRTIMPTGESSAWTTATVTDSLLVPGVPNLVYFPTTHTSSAAVDWSGAGARSYEYRVNGGVSATTTASGILAVGLLPGPNTVEVRSLNNFSLSDWATATIDFTPPTVPQMTVSATPGSVRYPFANVTLSGFANAPNVLVVLQQSTDGGATWQDTGLTWTTGIVPTQMQLPRTLYQSMWYRLTFAGSDGWLPATSNVLAVPYLPYFHSLSVPSRARHGRKFSVSLTAETPQRPTGSSATFVFYRYEKHGRHWVWRRRKSARVGGSVSASNALTYRATTSVAAGRWKVVANYAGGRNYGSTTATSKIFRVR